MGDALTADPKAFEVKTQLRRDRGSRQRLQPAFGLANPVGVLTPGVVLCRRTEHGQDRYSHRARYIPEARIITDETCACANTAQLSSTLVCPAP